MSSMAHETKQATPSGSVSTVPRVVVVVGLPGSGKSTYLEQLGVAPLSSDNLRYLLTDDPADQTINRLIFSILRELLAERLKLRRPVTYIDATNLTPWERRPYIRLAELYGARAEALFFDVPLEVCLQRNRMRKRVVPEEAIRRMAQRMIPPSIDEGFSKITIVCR